MDLRHKKVMVTGGAGFIGSELVRQLAKQAEQVVVVDNLVNGKRENLDGLPGNVELVIADIRERELMGSLLSGIDIVFHLACLGLRHSIHSPQENHDVNASGTLKLLGAARSTDVKRFVYVSTSEIYGTAQHVQMSEQHPVCPKTVYGASKLAGEGYTRAFWETYRYPTVIVRPFNSYGPRSHHEGDSGEVIPKFVLRCLAGMPMVIFGDGTQTRDFTFVSDTARGIVQAAVSDAALGQTINLGSGQEIQIKALAAKIAEALGRSDAKVLHDEPRPGDVLRLCADTTKAQRVLGFRPKVTFYEGIRLLADWYRGNGYSAEALLQHEVVRNWEERRRAIGA